MFQNYNGSFKKEVLELEKAYKIIKKYKNTEVQKAYEQKMEYHKEVYANFKNSYLIGYYGLMLGFIVNCIKDDSIDPEMYLDMDHFKNNISKRDYEELTYSVKDIPNITEPASIGQYLIYHNSYFKEWFETKVIANEKNNLVKINSFEEWLEKQYWKPN